MKRSWLWIGSLVLFLPLIFPEVTSAQQAVGVVTALKGKAQLTRAATQTSLRFKDDLNLRDLIDTQERSLARVLFGGKSTVTVRELSRLEVREELLPGGATRTIHELSSGSILVNVARSLMRRGDEVQIRTPNAVAAVRGSTIFAQYNAALAQSIFILLTGSAIVTPQGLPPITLTPLASVNLTGTAAAGVQTTQGTVTQAEANKIAEASEVGTGGRTEESAESGLQEAAQLTTALLGEPPAAATEIVPLDLGPAVDPTILTAGGKGDDISAISKELVQLTGGGNLVENGGFETGDFTGWDVTGARAVITSFGSFSPTEGSKMALIHTGTDADGNVAVGNTTSTLSQSFSVGSILLIKFDYNFLSNEFPSQSTLFNDTFEARLIDSDGDATLLASADRNSSFTSSDLSTAAASAGGFTLSAGNGQTGFQSVSKTVVVDSGTATLEFKIFDVGDTGVDSGVLIDNNSVTQDPPLYLVRDGQMLVGPSSGALIKFSDQSSTFDSALIACCPGPQGPSSVSLSGPLLKAERSDLTVPFSMVGLLDGSRLTTTSSDPLVWLQDGTYALSTIEGTAIFDFWGTATGVDAQTGVSVGTGKTVEHRGPLLQASGGATVNTAKVLKLDTALLEATAPVIRLVGSSNSQTSLTSSGTTIDLIKSKVTSLGPVIALDRGLINVSNGPLINLTKGSNMNVTGDLLSLVSGSKVNVVNGPLIAVSGNGSLLDVSGALVNFGGTGGNQIVVNNTITPTATLNGLPVSTANGGTVAIGSNPVKNPSLGTISVTGSLIQVTNNGTVNIAAP